MRASLRAPGPTSARRIPAAWRDPALRGTLAYYSLFVCLGMDMSLLGPTLPALRQQAHATLGQMGLLLLVGSVGGVLGTAVSGWFYDRVRGHIVLGAAQLCEALFLALIPLAPHFGLLAVIAVLKGVAQSFVNMGTNTLLIWTHREKPGPYMSGLHFSFGLGAFLAPLAMAQLAGSPGGYRLAYWGLSALAAFLGLRTVRLPASPRPARGEPAKSFGDAKPRAAAAPYAFVLVTALFLFFETGAEVGFRSWIYTYAITLGLAGAAGAAYLNSAFWLAFTVGRLVSIAVAVRLGPRQIIPAAVGGCLLSAGVALALPGSGAALWAATLGLGFCMSPVWPTGFTLAGQSVGLSGRLSSLILLGSSFGGMLLPSVLGRVMEAAGARWMMALILANMVLNLAAFAGMLRLRPRK